MFLLSCALYRIENKVVSVIFSLGIKCDRFGVRLLKTVFLPENKSRRTFTGRNGMPLVFEETGPHRSIASWARVLVGLHETYTWSTDNAYQATNHRYHRYYHHHQTFCTSNDANRTIRPDQIASFVHSCIQKHQNHTEKRYLYHCAPLSRIDHKMHTVSDTWSQAKRQLRREYLF